MKKKFSLVLVFLCLSSLTLLATNPSNAMNEDQKGWEEKEPADHLLIVWTSGDPDVAHKMVFMYAFNAQKNGWWDQVTLLVWGPSALLTSQDKDIRASLKKMQDKGVELLACKGCADQYGVSSNLEDLGIEVKYTGTYLTEFLKSGKKVITF